MRRFADRVEEGKALNAVADPVEFVDEMTFAVFVCFTRDVSTEKVLKVIKKYWRTEQKVLKVRKGRMTFAVFVCLTRDVGPVCLKENSTEGQKKSTGG